MLFKKDFKYNNTCSLGTDFKIKIYKQSFGIILLGEFIMSDIKENEGRDGDWFLFS